MKVPSTLARPSSATVRQTTPEKSDRPSSAATQQKQQQQQPNDDQHHFLTFNTRDTPDDLRATRQRIDKHRYHPSLDSYPPRPQTCPVRPTESLKPPTPQNELEQTSNSSPKTEAWIINDDKPNYLPDNDTSSSILIQMVDCDGLPTEYVDALDTANHAQEEYLRNLKMNVERRPENVIYRLPDNNTDSFVSQ